jgi:peptidyl-prolyl cis-trans isomerase D|tara:strand:- start:2 stop:1456 length:1455 start_codon:yes stop_codon:yes gene_type:complete
MIKSIGKYSKSFFIKVLVGIIILPFVFWGMGDVFRGGNQNIIVAIDSKKISTQEFINYLNRLGLSDEERGNISKSNMLENILSDYIGRKIINYEVESMGVRVSDASLKNIIINDKVFFKDGKFSRTAYEKFLLESSVSAPAFEQNIKEQEKRRQLLSYLSDGLMIPDFLVEKEFKKENQIKTIKYIDLNQIYDEQKISSNEIEKMYDENKDLFVEEFKSITFIELTPENLIGQKEANEKYFEKIDEIENDLLDGSNISDIEKKNNLTLTTTKEINRESKNINGAQNNTLDNIFFSKIFLEKEINNPKVYDLENKYFLAQISSINKKNKDLKDEKVLNAIKSQIKIQNIIKENTDLIKEISSKKFNIKKMQKLASDNGIVIKNTEISKKSENKDFTKNLVQNIFDTKNSEFNLITNSRLSKNFIIYTVKTEYKNLDKSSKVYESYKSKAKLNFAKNIYDIYDENVNKKYDIDLNNKVIERIKNSF